jgi:thiosulfate/3-mercaptopyruvate sulfurtransferase
MKNEILIAPNRLDELIRAGECTVVDCRFDLADPEKGRDAWRAGHIPGAVYAHLDEDLASPIGAMTGRHPLPEAGVFSEFLASAGWVPGRLLVAYDDGSNAISVRLWWLMRFFGHPAALLDGGLAGWLGAGLPLEAGAVNVRRGPDTRLEPAANMTKSSEDVLAQLEAGGMILLDARASERYSGAVEHLDVRAGHIPGALNRPFGENLDSRGRFKAPRRLRAEFEDLLGARGSGEVVHSCGSGVTACHNLFAMELAGLNGTWLYPGSWSEWIRDPARPIKTGNDP